MELEKLGFDSWFQEKIDSEKLNYFQIARVTSVHKDSYMITSGMSEVRAELTGKLIFMADSPLDYPAVGDWCYVQLFDDDSLAIIHEIFPRRTLLKRKTPGKKVDFQLIASNIDKAFIIQALDDDFNIKRLERYLVMVNESQIIPVVLLSKSDLLTGAQREEKCLEIQKNLTNVQVVPFSNTDHSGLEVIKAILKAGETFCLLGSSGVGKTTLLNNLLGEDTFETQAVREKDSKGKHTTTHRQLIILDNDTMIIDVPGIRELGNIGVEVGIDQTFYEITELAEKCRFRGCSHLQEKGCAVLKAVKKGDISEDRYDNYIKMTKESAYYEMSYQEKRNKDKAFGKMIKTVLKNKKNKC